MSSNPFTSNRFSNLDNSSFQEKPKNKKPVNNSNSFIKKSEQKVKYLDINNTEIFPDLANNSEKEKEKEVCLDKNKNKNIQKFSDIVNNNPNEFIEKKDREVKPGWVEIYLDKNTRKIIHAYNENDLNLNDELNNDINDNLDIIMNDVIESINKNRLKYINYYDSIHGEGAFEELHYLPPVYGPEYDSESEEESNEEDENDEYDSY